MNNIDSTAKVPRTGGNCASELHIIKQCEEEVGPLRIMRDRSTEILQLLLTISLMQSRWTFIRSSSLEHLCVRGANQFLASPFSVEDDINHPSFDVTIQK